MESYSDSDDDGLEIGMEMVHSFFFYKNKVYKNAYT